MICRAFVCKQQLSPFGSSQLGPDNAQVPSGPFLARANFLTGVECTSLDVATGQIERVLNAGLPGLFTASKRGDFGDRFQLPPYPNAPDGCELAGDGISSDTQAGVGAKCLEMDDLALGS
jgi:hypothetical protein